MNAKLPDTPWTDPDDAPELTDEFFEHADRYVGQKLVRRGKPRLEKPKGDSLLPLMAMPFGEVSGMCQIDLQDNWCRRSIMMK